MRSMIYCIVAAFLFAGVSGCAAGKAYSTGEQLEAEGKYEEAMLSYAEAYRVAPDVPEYRLRFLSVRDRAAGSRYAKGMQELNSGDYAAALVDFQVANGLDPSKELYKQLIDSTNKKKDALQAFREGMDFEKDNKPKYANLSYEYALELDPENSEYLTARDRVRALLDTRPSGYELNLKSLKPFAFKFTGSGLKDVFRILSQLSGINFIFDEGVKDQPVTINLERTNFKQVLDLLSTMNKLGSSVLNEKTVLIYPKTADKIKQYEEMQLHTFHLNYMDAKKGINLIRTMLPARKIYVNEEANSIVVRDTTDTVKVIEKLLDANDLPDAEVMLDVEVMELNDRNVRNVGLVLSRYGVDIAAFDLNSGLQLADRLSEAASGDSTTNAGVDNLVNVFNWNGYGGFVTVPSATYNFGKTMAKGEILANPKIRVKNKEKAKFTVGTRVPITTTTTNGTVGGYSVNVQYVDVGVKLNAEPVIQLNNVVDIKLTLEVSSIVGQETLADGVTTVVTIGTRNLETVLSLKDGETSVIGGLISRTNTDAKTKIFLLGDIPVIGPFISGNLNSKEKTEIVLAITPHLVRALMAPKVNVTSFMSGKEDDPSLDTFPPATDEEPGIGAVPRKPGQAPAQPPPSPGAPQPAAGLQQPPLPVPAVQQQDVTPSAAAQPAPAGAAQPAAPLAESGPGLMPQPVPAAPSAASAQDTPDQGTAPLAEDSAKGGQIIISTPMTAKVGEPFTLEIRAGNVDSIRAASYVLTFDPNLLVPVSFAEGSFLKKPGMKTSFTSSVDAIGGTVSMNLALPPGSPGVSGAGVLSTAVFRPKKAGTAAFGFRDVTFSSANGAPLSIVPFATSIGIQ